MHDAQKLKICSIFKEQICARKVFSYYTLQYISYLANIVFLMSSDMHVRPTRFTVLYTPTDSSDKTQLMCSTILLCLFVS